MNIYNNIATIVKVKGMTIAQLEREAGLGNGAIGKWRTGVPRVSSLEAVARVLKVSVNRLLKE